MSFSSLFRSVCKLILFLTTIYVYCGHPALSKSPKHLSNLLKITSALILFPFLSVALHESGTRKVVLDPWPNNTEDYLSPFIIAQKHTIVYRYIMFGRGICEKYQSRDEKFPLPNGEGNLVSRLVFFANTPPKHDISV